MIPTLEQVKAQCRIDADDDTENDLLKIYIGAAFKTVENYLNRPLSEMAPAEDAPPTMLQVTDDIRLAMLLVIAHWYENREPVISATVVRELPLSYRSLLSSYRITPM